MTAGRKQNEGCVKERDNIGEKQKERGSCGNSRQKNR